MINVKKYVTNTDMHKTTRLLTWNNIDKVTTHRTANLQIDKKKYVEKMREQYCNIFPNGFKRFKSLFNNTAQPDSHELLFFAKYLKCSIDNLVEHPAWTE